MLTKSGGCSDTAASMMANRDSDSGQSGKLASKSLCHPHISYHIGNRLGPITWLCISFCLKKE